MKFGQTHAEYLLSLGEKRSSFDLNKCAYIEYKKLKKVLQICRHRRGIGDSSSGGGRDFEGVEEDRRNRKVSDVCRDQSCQWCDKMFFSELMKETSDVAGCLSSRVKQLVQNHCTTDMHRYLLHFANTTLASFGSFKLFPQEMLQRFRNDQHALVQDGCVLIEYVIMNAIALRKILKKYDKVHKSVSGMNFKSKLRTEHLEILQSPWFIELVAFYINLNESNGVVSYELCNRLSCHLSVTEPESVLTLVLPDSVKLDYNLTCAVCLDIVFHPYALSCGHLFCKSCACSAASVMMFEGLENASPKRRCPVCRECGVFPNAVRMTELDLLLKQRCKEHWKEKFVEERAQVQKQTKEHWELQRKPITER